MGTGLTEREGAPASHLLAVVAATVAAGAAACLLQPGPSLQLDLFALVVLAFVIAGARTIRLDLGRQRCTMTAAPVVLAAVVGTLPALALGLAAAIGEAATLLPLHIGARKLAVNLAARWTAAVMGSAVFTALEPVGSGVTATAVRSCAAVLAYSAANAVTVSSAMATATGRPFVGVLRQTAAASGVVAVAGASLGGSARALAAASPLAPVLLAPMVLVIWQGSRAAVAQRDQHLRLVELYRAVAETVPLAEPAAALATMCDQTAGLVAADAAVVAMGWPGAPASGAVLGHRAGALSAGTAQAALDLAREGLPRVVSGRDLPPSLRSAFGERDVLVAGHEAPDGSAVSILAAVALGSGGAPEVKLETLATYASHVAVIASNFRLYTEAQDALRHQLDLNQRKDEFVATLSHELRTPLTVTIGALEAIVRYKDRMSLEHREELLADASSQAHRLRGLIDDLLTVAAGPSRIVLQQLTLDDLLTAIRGSVVPAIAGRTTIVAPTELDHLIVSHPRSVERILGNLLSNAAKYGGDGPVEVHIEPTSRHVVVTVVDHGPGIPAELVDVAFDRFVQLDQSDSRHEGGVGLGLYLCRRLADEAGAELDFRPTPGGGATFALTLPLDHDAVVRAPEVAA
jgi:signal transduction histidine kinase